jgi:Fe2+ or Zn2+ uptake regulation protein
MAMKYEEALARMQAAGLRITRPREVLLRLVLDTPHPFSVKMLHERAEREGLNIHLATVHRNLAEFVAVGLVDEIPGEDNRLYALHTENEGGAHVYCMDCRLVKPLAVMGVDTAVAEALAQGGFDTATVRLMLAAHCNTRKAQPDCPKEDD